MPPVKGGGMEIQMKKHMLLTTVLAAAFAGGFFGMSAQAKEVVFTGEKCPLTVVTDTNAWEAWVLSQGDNGQAYDLAGVLYLDGTQGVDESAQAGADAAGEAEQGISFAHVKETDSVHLLGILAGSYVPALFPDGEKGYLTIAEIERKIPSVSLADIPALDGWSDFGQGTNGEMTTLLQERLIAQGHLDGAADGLYGSGTAGAVGAFREASGMERTGSVDIYTWLLLEEKASGQQPVEAPYPPVFKVEEKFKDIYENTVTDLTKFLDPKWTYAFDVFEGEGSIRENLLIGTLSAGDTELDRISMSAELFVYITRDPAGRITLAPALEVKTTGSYRPYFQTAALRSANQVSEESVAVSRGDLDGIDVQEDSIFLLSQEMVDVMLASEGSGELVLRLTGTVDEFDMELTTAIQQIAEFAKMANDVFAPL